MLPFAALRVHCAKRNPKLTKAKAESFYNLEYQKKIFMVLIPKKIAR